MLYGSTSFNPPSRFLKEIPEELCNFGGMKRREEKRTVIGSSNSSFNSSYSQRSSYTAPSKRTDCKYTSGMTVEHNTFGKGKIIKTVPMGSDTLLEVQFEGIGLKKLMAGFAKLKVI